MNARTVRATQRRTYNQQGFTLVEVMVALTLALFLLGGLVTMVQSTRNSFGNQNQLTLLQDNERLAASIMTDVIQQAGYFPDPILSTAALSLPLAAPFVAAGQPVAGAPNATAALGDTITVQYRTSGTDRLFNCQGQNSGAAVTWIQTFSVNATGQLVCAINGAAAVPVVGGVQNLGGVQHFQILRLDVLYGVKTSAAVDNGSVDMYIRANDMTAANWASVISIRLRLTFDNPLFTVANAGQPATILFERVINVMSQAGVKT